MPVARSGASLGLVATNSTEREGVLPWTCHFLFYLVLLSISSSNASGHSPLVSRTVDICELPLRHTNSFSGGSPFDPWELPGRAPALTHQDAQQLLHSGIDPHNSVEPLLIDP